MSSVELTNCAGKWIFVACKQKKQAKNVRDQTYKETITTESEMFLILRFLNHNALLVSSAKRTSSVEVSP